MASFDSIGVGFLIGLEGLSWVDVRLAYENLRLIRERDWRKSSSSMSVEVVMIVGRFFEISENCEECRFSEHFLVTLIVLARVLSSLSTAS